MIDIQDVVKSYSPWLSEKTASDWERIKQALPEFRRPIFDALAADIRGGNNQIVSLTGPRRVGKTTLLQQLIRKMIDEDNLNPAHVIYYSLDDPALYRPGLGGAQVLEALMEHMAELGKGGPAYLFLDEIQTLERWELYLKKYYDLKYPIQIVISGSASSPIFKASRESLLGRVVDHHVLPFSFREYLLYVLTTANNAPLLAELSEIFQAGIQVRGMFAKHPDHVNVDSVTIPDISEELWEAADEALQNYFVDGGFPEVWSFTTQEEKLTYLFSNQVTKVIMEDLVLAVEFRKPEQLKAFYISLLEKPGREVNMTTLAGEIGVNTQQIDKYLPLLEMTHLIRAAAKFRKSPVRVRRGSQKFYPVDLALRNAVLRLGTEVLKEPSTIGLYAETLVFNALKKWQGVLQVDYYRDVQKEVDFIVHTRPNFYLPIEVKYATNTGVGQLKGLEKFRKKFSCHAPLLVTRRRNDFGIDETSPSGSFFRIPLPLFLLMFD